MDIISINNTTSFGKWEHHTVNGVHRSLKFISRNDKCSGCALWECSDSYISYDSKTNTYYLRHCCSSVAYGSYKSFKYHDKLKIYYTPSHGFYVTPRGARTYCNSLIPTWIRDIFT